MSVRDLVRFFEARKADSEGLVLATVFDTLGSTYSKAGDRMLIAGNGDFQGMLSGGCLEGDLAERAIQVAETGNAQSVTYDLRESDEDLWGLGVGCEGLMRIFLQRLEADEAHEPFPSLVDCLLGESPGELLTIIESSVSGIEPGAAMLRRVKDEQTFGIAAHALAPLRQEFERLGETGGAAVGQGEVDGETASYIYAPLLPAKRILVLGGGLDAEPVVRMLSELGWRVFVQDHRPAYIDKGDFSDAESVSCVPADELSDLVDLARFDAAICMSHHLVSDKSYLRQLAETPVPYIGLLGPVNRRNRLMEELGTLAERLEGRLHGPAGLDIGGRGPAAIALSIVAQMHQELVRG